MDRVGVCKLCIKISLAEASTGFPVSRLSTEFRHTDVHSSYLGNPLLRCTFESSHKYPDPSCDEEQGAHRSRWLLVRDHAGAFVFLILMLQKLAEITESPGTVGAMIRMVRDVGRTIPICQHGNLTHIRSHGALGGSEPVNLLSGIVFSHATTTVAALNVLHSISTRAEPLLSANRTGNVSWAMNLHVHVQLVLITKSPPTMLTRVLISAPVHTIAASRITRTLPPLVAAVSIPTAKVSALSTVPSHD